MDTSSRKVLKAVAKIIQQIKEDQQDLLEIAEDQERITFREVVYDLEQANTLVTRAVNR